MKKTYRRLAAAIMAALTAVPAVAQEFRTSYFMQTSHFRHQMNPALLDRPYFSALLGNVNVGTTGNVGVGDFVYKLDGNPRYDLTTFMSPTVSPEAFLGNIHDKNRLDIYANYNIFSTAFRGFGGTNLVELNARSNTNLSLPGELFEFAKTAGARTEYQLHDIGLRSQNYLELAFGHSRRIDDRLTVGGKVKLLLGIAYADFSVDRLDVTMNGDAWRVAGDARLKSAVMGSKFSHENADKNAPDGRPRVNGLDDVGFGLAGFGLAFDLGAAYKVTDDLTVSAGLTDLGFISWNKARHASSRGDYTFDGFSDIYAGGTDTGDNKLGDQFERLGDDLEELFSVYDDGEKSATQALAATLNAGAEYTLPAYRPLRFGFLYTGRYSGLFTYHQAMLSATVRPVGLVEVSASTAVGSTGCTVGGAVALKFGPVNVYAGTDRFFGKVSKSVPLPISKANSSVNLGVTFGL